MTDNITVSRELLRQVLRLMDKALDTDNVFGNLHNDAMDCLGALRAALEQPAQKTCGRCVVFCQGGEGCHCNAPQISQRGRERLVSDQLNRRPAVEPVAEVAWDGVNLNTLFIRFLPAGIGLSVGTKLYTPPPPPAEVPMQPRKAVKLTDDEISDIAIDNPPNVHIYARAIEQAVWAKLGVSE